MAIAPRHISGGRFNPAVLIDLWAGGRSTAREIGPCSVAQVLGGIAAGTGIYRFISSDSSSR